LCLVGQVVGDELLRRVAERDEPDVREADFEDGRGQVRPVVLAQRVL